MIKPWKKVGSKPVGDFRIFKMRSDTCVNPRTGEEHNFFVFDSVNWVNVIAVTPDEKLVLVEQYRHGSNTIELEIPGGMMDPHESDPVVTAVRELREETGYEGTHPRELGQVWSNPAIMSNTTFTVLIENCELKHSLEFDSGEDLITRLMPLGEINQLVASGKIKHSLVVAALFHFDLWRRGIKKG
jgi:ADP-ribose pyrophosphatase